MKSFNNEIDRMEIKHAKVEEVRNKLKRDDDCFGIMHDPNDEGCKRCSILATYNGIEMRLFEVCSLMMKFEAVKSSENAEASATMNRPSEIKTEERKIVDVKPAEKKEVMEASAENIPCKQQKPLGKITEKMREKANMVVEAIKAGHVAQSDIAKHLGWENPPTNQLLRKLMEEGTITREEKEGSRSLVYRVL